MIECSDICKKYNGKYVLKNFTYRFDNGLYLILGHSGVGKTTLLNILSFNDINKEGNVCVEGDLLYFKDSKNLVNKLTVKEHFKLFETINKTKIKYFCDIRKIINKKIKSLSLGEKQIIILTLALNSKVKNIILDEPLSALSNENMNIFKQELEKESKNKTIIISTHNNIFDKCIKIYLSKKNKEKNTIETCNQFSESKNKMKFAYIKTYIKKVFAKKAFFILSILMTFFSFLGVSKYINQDFNNYLKYLKEREGMVIGQKNLIKNLNEDVFYQVIKKLSLYVTDYNINYYNSLLYNYNISVDEYYIDNGFTLSSIKYIEKDLRDSEFVLGLNIQDFCKNNLLNHCDINYINSLLINKPIQGFPFIISEVFENEETIFLSDERFIKFYDYNDYEEYYFDIKVEDKENIFKTINDDEFLSCFEFTLIGANDSFNRYKVEIKDYKYFTNVEYNKYLVCLDNGYDCLDHLKPFVALERIDEIETPSELSLKIIDDKLNDNEIVISLKLSEILRKNKGDNIMLYFDYNNEIKQVELNIKEVINDNSLTVYQNSDWSLNLFKNILKYNQNDLRIKNILIYEEIKENDYQCDDIYNELVKKYKTVFLKIKHTLFIINLSSSVTSIIILIILELFQNKFKKEYFNYLKVLNVNVDKKKQKKEPKFLNV